jgi:hypothetical protein
VGGGLCEPYIMLELKKTESQDENWRGGNPIDKSKLQNIKDDMKA